MLKLKSLAAVSLLVMANGCADMGELTTADDFEIVGGVNANIADYPWQISLQSSSGFHFCGGSVLSAEWILTAQHCTDGQSPSSMRVAAGSSTLSGMSSTGQIRNVAEIIPFPGYVDASKGKDVSLLRLATPLTLNSNVAAISLVTEADATAGLTNPGVVSTVTGWGALSSGGSSPDRLQTVDVPIVSNADAQAAYPSETITADQLAAGLLGVGGKDSCQGDSGGPLVVPNGAGGKKLGGVVSWGYGCADPRYPGLYARVSSFATWIQNTMGGQTPPPTGTELQDGQTVSNLSAAASGWLHYFIQVPAGASNFTASISGGTGDADLYVKFGSQPTTSSYDCRPYQSGNAETCTFATPSAGTYYVSIRAYSAFSGVSLTVNYDTGGGGGYPGVELTQSNQSGAASSWKDFSIAVPADANKLTVKITGGTGDADLYVRKGTKPTTSTYDCRPYTSGNEETCSFTTGAGGATWYISIRGYSSYSGVTLTADYDK